ncbi:MAG: serine/threonine-protein kinase [Xanthomonadales bacterium]|nr:serine/threonine-protein kinase [Xanthomonadales bacterium]
MRERFGPYQVIAELGRGGMGAVYKAFEPELNRHVAIKVMSEALAHDPVVVERFLREARAMAALSDPHIIQIYTIGTEEGQPYFAMEYIEGESLSAKLKREGRLAPAEALSILHQTAAGLASAHDRGVVHRDIKPGNLMITRRGLVKIADFGIALSTRDLSRKLTSTGEFVGTPGYLSPEVCLGKPVDARSDIFSLGIVFFEMLTGQIPFREESPLGMMLEVVKAEIPDVRELGAEVDEAIAAILRRMIAKEPEDRFQDCHELASAVAAHPLLAGRTAPSATLRGGASAGAPAAATVAVAAHPGLDPTAGGRPARPAARQPRRPSPGRGAASRPAAAVPGPDRRGPRPRPRRGGGVGLPRADPLPEAAAALGGARRLPRRRRGAAARSRSRGGGASGDLPCGGRRPRRRRERQLEPLRRAAWDAPRHHPGRGAAGLRLRRGRRTGKRHPGDLRGRRGDRGAEVRRLRSGPGCRCSRRPGAGPGRGGPGELRSRRERGPGRRAPHPGRGALLRAPGRGRRGRSGDHGPLARRGRRRDPPRAAGGRPPALRAAAGRGRGRRPDPDPAGRAAA